jgi:hypothetical protein
MLFQMSGDLVNAPDWLVQRLPSAFTFWMLSVSISAGLPDKSLFRCMPHYNEVSFGILDRNILPHPSESIPIPPLE